MKSCTSLPLSLSLSLSLRLRLCLHHIFSFFWDLHSTKMWEQKQRKLSELALTDSVPLLSPHPFRICITWRLAGSLSFFFLLGFALCKDVLAFFFLSSPFSFLCNLHFSKICWLSLPFSFFWDLHYTKICWLSLSSVFLSLHCFFLWDLQGTKKCLLYVCHFFFAFRCSVASFYPLLKKLPP